MDPTYEESIWETLMFLGRYAHQPLRDLLALTMRELLSAINALGKYMKAEGDSFRERVMGGG